MTIKETDLYKPLKEMFNKYGWEVYGEVVGRYGSKRADIVATYQDKVAVVEMKTTLSLDLLEQAVEWKGKADYIFIAVPKRKGKIKRVVKDILKLHGIGLLEIDLRNYEKGLKQGLYKYWRRPMDYGEWKYLDGEFGITVSNPCRNRVTFKNFFNVLTDEQKEMVGGTSGEYVTTYKLLIADIIEYLRISNIKFKGDGWKTLNEICEHINNNSKDYVVNHYRNQKSGIRNALNKFEYERVESKKVGNRVYYKIRE